MKQQQTTGFTLAELLIALAILGVIATFTIPKVLNGQTSSKWNSQAKEVAASLTQAVKQHQYNGSLTALTKSADLTQYLNYVAVDTTTTIDLTSSTLSCSAGRCIKLHNGGMLLWFASDEFCNTTAQNAVPFFYDPDGVTTGDQSLLLWIYTTGEIRSNIDVKPVTVYGSAGTCTTTVNPPGGGDPTWFSWDN